MNPIWYLMITGYKILSLGDLGIWWEVCFLLCSIVVGISWLKVMGSHLVDCVLMLMVV